MLVTLNFSQNEREKEGGGATLGGGRIRLYQTIEHARYGPVNRQESWEVRSAFRVAHSVSQFKAQHI